MRALLTAAVILVATPVAAQDNVRFNLHCSEFENPDTLRTSIDHQFSVDLQAMSVCRRGNPRCATVVRHGRFLEFSYPFSDDTTQFEMFRLYDPQTGWLTQIMRVQGEVGRTYGDALCEVRPFTAVTD